MFSQDDIKLNPTFQMSQLQCLEREFMVEFWFSFNLHPEFFTPIYAFVWLIFAVL